MGFKTKNIENGFSNRVLIKDITNFKPKNQQGIKVFEKVPLVNIVAVLINKISDNEGFIDDETGTIRIKDFNSHSLVKDFNIGDVVLVIGKLRAFNSTKIISLSGISKLDPEWLQKRKNELKNSKNDPELSENTEDDSLDAENSKQSSSAGKKDIKKSKKSNKTTAKNKTKKTDTSKSESSKSENKKKDENEENIADLNEEEVNDNEDFNDDSNDYEDDEEEDSSQIFFKILEVIEKKDKGEGCPFEDIYPEFKLKREEVEKYINYLIQEGQIFEISSGKLKVV